MYGLRTNRTWTEHLSGYVWQYWTFGRHLINIIKLLWFFILTYFIIYSQLLFITIDISIIFISVRITLFKSYLWLCNKMLLTFLVLNWSNVRSILLRNIWKYITTKPTEFGHDLFIAFNYIFCVFSDIISICGRFKLIVVL